MGTISTLRVSHNVYISYVGGIFLPGNISVNLTLRHDAAAGNWSVLYEEFTGVLYVK